MSDPVERIKAAISDGRRVNDAVAIDAADEIMRLRKENEDLRDLLIAEQRRRVESVHYTILPACNTDTE